VINFILKENLSELFKNFSDKSFILNLAISIERDIYNKHCNDFFEFIKTFVQNKNISKCSCIQIDIGDTLNRHNWYYRYCEEYMIQNNLLSEKQIPSSTREEFYKKSYQKGREQGKEWFKNNIKAINQLIPKGYKLNRDFKLNDELTVLYKGDKNNPKIEYIRHEYWLKNTEYKDIKIIFNSICEQENFGIDKAIKRTANNFFKLRKKNIKYKDLFLQQSYSYILDESISTIIMNKQNNCIEFYCGSEIPSIQTLKGRKAQNSPIIKKLMEKGQPLEGADKRKFVSVKVVEEKED
jgi:hypothetical protein